VPFDKADAASIRKAFEIDRRPMTFLSNVAVCFKPFAGSDDAGRPTKIPAIASLRRLMESFRREGWIGSGLVFADVDDSDVIRI
jgi:hypothetical protein